MYKVNDTEKFLIYLARTKIEKGFPVKQYFNIDWMGYCFRSYEDQNKLLYHQLFCKFQTIVQMIH